MLLSILNFLAIAPCFVSKLPQILLIAKTQNVRGVSLESVLLDIFCYVNTGSFSFFEGYPISQFMEYPLLLTQTVVILILFGHISNRKLRSYLWLCFFCFQCYCFSIIPKHIALSLIGTNTVIGSISKAAQISAIIKSGTSGNVSFTGYLFNFISSGSRLSSMMLAGIGEQIIKLNFLISVVGNAGVMLAVYIYRPADHSEHIKKD